MVAEKPNVSLFGYSAKGQDRSRYASYMSKEDREAAKTYLARTYSGGHSWASGARWHLTVRALEDVQASLSFIPNSIRALAKWSDKAHY